MFKKILIALALVVLTNHAAEAKTVVNFKKTNLKDVYWVEVTCDGDDSARGVGSCTKEDKTKCAKQAASTCNSIASPPTGPGGRFYGGLSVDHDLQPSESRTALSPKTDVTCYTMGPGCPGWEEYCKERGICSPGSSSTLSTRSNKARWTRSNKARWTPWLDRDDPAGSGDYELLRDFAKAGKACSAPLKIECRQVGGVRSSRAGSVDQENHRCEVALGGVCDNRKQSPGVSCSDYEIRFLCPGSERTGLRGSARSQ